MNTEQRFLFDTFGYLVIPNILTPEQVDQLRSSADSEDPPLHRGSAWRQLLDLPQISPVIEDLVGNPDLPQAPLIPSFRVDHVYVHTHVRRGFPGMDLHGGWKSSGGNQFFKYHDGRFYNGLIVVAFELHDTTPNGGGFCCIPGTHKSNVSMPNEWRSFANGVHPVVKGVPAHAGDAIIFTEVLTHGTLPWTVDNPRKTIFLKFSPHGTSWSADYYKPEEFVKYSDVDDRKLAILEPPNARYAGRKTARIWVDPQAALGKNDATITCTHLELRRPLSAGTDANAHHLHIRQIEAFDSAGQKMQVQVIGASGMMAQGASLGERPEATVDGKLTGGCHNAIQDVQYGSEDHWIQFRLQPPNASVARILLHNRTDSCGYRLVGSTLALQTAGGHHSSDAAVQDIQRVVIGNSRSCVITFSVNEFGELVQTDALRLLINP